MLTDIITCIRMTALLMERLCIYYAAAAEGSIVFLFCFMSYFFFFLDITKLDILFWAFKPEQTDFSRKPACLCIEETGEIKRRVWRPNFLAYTERIRNSTFHLLVTSCSKQSISGKLFKLVCQINVFDYIKRVTDYHILIIILVTILTFTHLFYFIQ